MKLKISAIVVLIGLSLSALGLGRLLNREETNSFVPDGKLYSMPEMKKKPRKFWTCTGVVSIDNRNSINETETMQGLQYHLLCQSLAGLTNRMVEEGKSDVAVWLYDHGGKASYKVSKQALEDMGICEQGVQNGLELACSDYESVDGLRVQLRGFFDGYVLTDVKNNPESGIVASVASHVYNSIIVDVRDKEYFEKAGYSMKYDATHKTTLDAWHEFKDKCSNEALVIMPVQTGELREFAIKNNLFVLNLNKKQGDPRSGQNVDLLEEVLAWLQPNVPVYGWEQGVSEDQFVARISKSGHPMIPCDWSYNHSLTSLLYTERQQPVQAQSFNPKLIDFDKKRNYVSFFLSDGDNIQWMMQDFATGFYDVLEAIEVKMSYGLPVSTLSMMAPAQLHNLMNLRRDECSVLEMLGGGYYYIDTYSQNNNRNDNLKIAAERLAVSMRRYHVGLLGVMAMDVKSVASKEAYQTFVDANDRLEGIIALQYSPYAGGGGEVFWVTNKNGYDIPVITVRYSLWDRIHEREGSPDFIASKLKAEAQVESFSAICVHAWSRFEGNAHGAAAARLCAGKLDGRFEVVNMQELVWRLRMSRHPEQTLEYLNKIF
ncbi:GxGYxYP domain-containing protein [Bacteroides cellulosilyticus]|uniref:GxGYxYP domain-containing protein n=1 Tax=Bacteroides cellulosilyticus TaxID=246787 RepID=UPI001897B93F|nr:GxGYxYP domain-containing protein [Bacteroides cellulosilyticus]